MKNRFLFRLGILTLIPLTSQGQSSTGSTSDSSATFLFSSQCISMTLTPELRSLENTRAYVDEDKEHVVYNNLRRQKYTNLDAFPHGPDAEWQRAEGKLNGKAPIQNWEGNDNGVYPPDPSGAAGPHHYIQMINSEYIIYDKEGTILAGPNSLASIVGSDAGDPIVMYDRFADKWILSAFGGGSSLAVAVSTTSDPLGTYWLYNFPMGSFPDYPKYGLWHDGYYVTSNTSGADCFVFEREKMIVGDATAAMIAMDTPILGTGAGTETGGFHSVLPAHADFVMPPSDKKLNLFYFQDDAWTGIPDDAIKIWEVTTNWDDPGSSSIDLVQTLLTAPFDSQFNAYWNDIQQPGTGSKLDGVPGAFMYRAQYTEWESHNTVMLNHTVDVDMTNHAGIRWYELREIAGSWEIYQQSTFAPDDQSRWMGSISMDNQGNIGLAYTMSGSVIYPSLYYTGRYAADPTGEMTIEEIEAIEGTSIQTGINRFGDYAHMSVDPEDDQTFWYTGEYLAGGRKTRIFSFKLASDYEHDIGVSLLNSPVDDVLTASETIEITITNYGASYENDFDVSYQMNDGVIVTETYTAGPIATGATDTYTFGTTADMAIEGVYNFSLWTDLDTDEYLLNDTLNTSVLHKSENDLGVIAINSPNSGSGLSDEIIQVTIENFGLSAQSDFDVAFILDGLTPITETVVGPLIPGETMVYDFATTGDFSVIGFHDIWAYTDLDGDSDLLSDTTFKEVETYICAPESACGFGDGYREFQLGTIDNSSECAPDGYTDYTFLMTDLMRGETHDIYAASEYDPQYMSVWIDFNDNFYFDDDEKIISAFKFDYGGSTVFYLPIEAPLGEHLLRAKASDNPLNISDPCDDMTYGETEDYKVNILPSSSGPDVDFIADIVSAPPTTIISFTDLSTNDPTVWGWTITPPSGFVYVGGTTNTSQNPEIQFNAAGLYAIQLDAANDIDVGSEVKVDYINISNSGGIVENFLFGLELVSKEGNVFQYNLLGSSEPFDVEIHDAMGKLVYQATVSPTSSKTLFTFDLSQEASGYYLIHVSDSNHSQVEKIFTN